MLMSVNETKYLSPHTETKPQWSTASGYGALTRLHGVSFKFLFIFYGTPCSAVSVLAYMLTCCVTGVFIELQYDSARKYFTQSLNLLKLVLSTFHSDFICVHAQIPVLCSH